ncbi:MAG TPA: hypothetical protein VD907_01405 [Verrucomicrobiae bacterium]|nr:hypothetical protein [Verrucomicrobiae bacterium]
MASRNGEAERVLHPIEEQKLTLLVGHKDTSGLVPVLVSRVGPPLHARVDNQRTAALVAARGALVALFARRPRLLGHRFCLTAQAVGVGPAILGRRETKLHHSAFLIGTVKVQCYTSCWNRLI